MSERFPLLDVSSCNVSDWRVVTDQVMGGVSSAEISYEEYAGKACMRLAGEVSTENNGGFVQVVLDMASDAAFDATAYDGVAITVAGNGEQYNLHLRTTDLWLPWQSYRASFTAGDWQTITLPFASLEPYRTFRGFKPERLTRVGIVAIGRDFNADLCVSEVYFYSSEK